MRRRNFSVSCLRFLGSRLRFQGARPGRAAAGAPPQGAGVRVPEIPRPWSGRPSPCCNSGAQGRGTRKGPRDGVSTWSPKCPSPCQTSTVETLRYSHCSFTWGPLIKDSVHTGMSYPWRQRGLHEVGVVPQGGVHDFVARVLGRIR